MRFPIILALAVVVLTPANIRDIVHETAGQARVAIAKFLDNEPVQIAEAELTHSRLDPAGNTIADVR